MAEVKSTDINEVTLQGRVVSVVEILEGEKNGKEWSLQQIVVSTQVGKYKNNVILNAWNTMVDVTHKLKVGEEIQVKANATSQERSGKWQTNLTIQSLKRV